MRMGEISVRVKEVHDQMDCGSWQMHVLYFMNKVLEQRCGELRLTFAPKPKPKAAAVLEEKKGRRSQRQGMRF